MTKIVSFIVTNISVVTFPDLNFATFSYTLLLFIAQAWLQENNVLSIVLKDNLHQPQVSAQCFCIIVLN